MDVARTELTIYDQSREEIKKKLDNTRAQYVSIYEHPWVYKYRGLLFDANRETFLFANSVAFLSTFRLVYHLF